MYRTANTDDRLPSMPPQIPVPGGLWGARPSLRRPLAEKLGRKLDKWLVHRGHKNWDQRALHSVVWFHAAGQCRVPGEGMESYCFWSLCLWTIGHAISMKISLYEECYRELGLRLTIYFTE